MYGRQKITEYLSSIIKSAFENISGADNISPSIQIETPKEERNGDFSTNIAMKYSKALAMNPRQLADLIVENIGNDHKYISKVQVAGAGFINFYMNNDWLYDELDIILSEKYAYGQNKLAESKRINVEYVSANPTGPLHIGNARGGAVGDALANIYKWAGWECEKEFYLNDAGNQIKKFAQSLSARYMQLYQEDYPFPEDGYRGEDIILIAENYKELFADKLLNVPDSVREAELADFGLKINIDNMKKVLDQYGVAYDTWFKESDLHNSSAIDDIVTILTENGATYEKDGALWFKATDYDCEKDEVLIRQNGVPTYYLADIAYHFNKLSVRNFDLAVDVWGADHHGHVHRMKMALKAAGIDPERLHIVLMQLVRLVKNDEAVRMSKRKGEIVTLDELIEDVGVDAARFVFNSYAPSTHMDFDLDLAIKQSSENPVFYVQYAYARMCSILEAVEITDILPDFVLLNSKQEIALLKRMADFSTQIELSAKEFDPSRMTKYAYDLASDFHSFYNACRVKSEDEVLTVTRYRLLEGCRYILKNTLDILGVSAPQKM